MYVWYGLVSTDSAQQKIKLRKTALDKLPHGSHVDDRRNDFDELTFDDWLWFRLFFTTKYKARIGPLKTCKTNGHFKFVLFIVLHKRGHDWKVSDTARNA